MTEVAKGFTRMSLQNQRLETELRSSLRELKASRSRIMSAADEERRRIERDLHDGAQQRLLALAIQLEMAGELVASDPGKGAERIHELVEDVNEAMADIRSLASGLYPSLLLERGLVEALSEAAAACSVPTTLTAGAWGGTHPRSRVPSTSAVARRSRTPPSTRKGARSAPIKLWEADAAALRGARRRRRAPATRTTSARARGITNMRDRIGAMGGTLAIESHPGAGTCVMGAVPLAPVDVPLPIDSLLRRATDALPDCFAIYRAVTDARGNVADFAVEHMNDAARRDLGVGARGARGADPRPAAARLPALASVQVASARRRARGARRARGHGVRATRRRSPPPHAVLRVARRPARRRTSRRRLEGRDRARSGGRGSASPIDGAASSGGGCLPHTGLGLR